MATTGDQDRRPRPATTLSAMTATNDIACGPGLPRSSTNRAYKHTGFFFFREPIKGYTYTSLALSLPLYIVQPSQQKHAFLSLSFSFVSCLDGALDGTAQRAREVLAVFLGRGLQALQRQSLDLPRNRKKKNTKQKQNAQRTKHIG